MTILYKCKNIKANPRFKSGHCLIHTLFSLFSFAQLKSVRQTKEQGNGVALEVTIEVYTERYAYLQAYGYARINAILHTWHQFHANH